MTNPSLISYDKRVANVQKSHTLGSRHIARGRSGDTEEKMVDKASYQAYCRLLEKELICAMGCTEPIAIAYCAAVSRAALGCLPDKVRIAVSGNIIKNVKSVIIKKSDVN